MDILALVLRADIGFKWSKRSAVASIYGTMQLARFLVIGATARAFAPAPRAPTPVRLHGAYEDAVRSSAYEGAFA